MLRISLIATFLSLTASTLNALVYSDSSLFKYRINSQIGGYQDVLSLLELTDTSSAASYQLNFGPVDPVMTITSNIENGEYGLMMMSSETKISGLLRVQWMKPLAGNRVNVSPVLNIDGGTQVAALDFNTSYTALRYSAASGTRLLINPDGDFTQGVEVTGALSATTVSATSPGGGISMGIFTAP